MLDFHQCGKIANLEKCSKGWLVPNLGLKEALVKRLSYQSYNVL